jgi:hypothetical protein
MVLGDGGSNPGNSYISIISRWKKQYFYSSCVYKFVSYLENDTGMAKISSDTKKKKSTR